MQPQVKSHTGRQGEGSQRSGEHMGGNHSQATENREGSESLQSNLMEGARNAASGVVSNLRDGASQFIDKAQGVATNVAGRAQEYGGAAIEQTSTWIRRNPTQAILIGFGAGIVLGMALSRRR